MACTSSLQLPRSFRFNPNEKEIIIYLQNTIAGKDSFIPHIDLYSHLPPGDIFPLNQEEDTDWWCFTTLKRASTSDCGFDRSAGDRCSWHESSKTTKIKIPQHHSSSTAVVASKKTFNFLLPMPPDDPELRRTPWSMHEYTLLSHPSLALCHVMLRHTKPSPSPSHDKVVSTVLPPPRPLPSLASLLQRYSPKVAQLGGPSAASTTLPPPASFLQQHSPTPPGDDDHALVQFLESDIPTEEDSTSRHHHVEEPAAPSSTSTLPPSTYHSPHAEH